MANLDSVIAALLGAAFGARTFDSNRSLLSRVGYGLVALDLVGALGKGEPSISGSVGRVSKQPRQLGDGRTPATKVEFHKVDSISKRVSYIHQQMLKGVKDPKVYSLAREVLTRKCNGKWCVPEKDARAEINAVFGEIKSRVRYTWDPVNYDAFQTPGKTLDLAAGDCDDMTSLGGAMLMSIGYKVRSRVVHTQGFPTWNHIYLMVQLPSKEWMPFDATVNKPCGWQVPDSLMVRPPQDFDVPDR